MVIRVGRGRGFGHMNRRTQGSGSAPVVPAPTATATMAQIPTADTNRIYQRSTITGGGQGRGQGTIPLTLSGATAGTVNARIRSSDGVTILQPEWQVGTITNGQTTLNVSGVDARLGWFFVDIRTAAGWQNGTTLVGMGALFGFAGQSLMARMFGRQDGQTATYASLGITPNPNSSTLATYSETNSYMPTVATMPWQTPGDVGNGLGPNSVGIGELLNRMIAMLGVNCGGIGHSQGGTNIGTYLTGGTNWTQLSSVLTRAGGAFEGFFWGQGHGDSIMAMPGPAYSNALTALFSQLTAANSFAGYGRYVWTIPTISVANWGSPNQKNAIRRAAETWCQSNSATYIHAYDFAQVDAIHQSQAGAITFARHMYRGARGYYGQTSGLGPRVLSASRSGTTITVTLSDVGQTTLVTTGNLANRIFVFPSGRFNSVTNAADNRFPVSSVTVVNKTTLSVVLANDPGDGHVLDLYLYYGAGPNDGTVDNIYDDRTDGDGLTQGRHVQANFTPVSIAAPVPAGAVNAPPSGFVSIPSTVSAGMVNTGVTYAAGAAGYGQEMTGGNSQNTTSVPYFTPITMEGTFLCPTIPAGTEVLWSNTGSMWLAINSSGRLTDGSISGATTLVAGKRYHIAYQQGPSGSAIYLTNITDALPGTRDAFSSTPVGTRSTTGNVNLRKHPAGFNLSAGSVDEVAMFYGERYSGATYTAPTAPYVGNEANLVLLYHLDGSTAESVAV